MVARSQRPSQSKSTLANHFGTLYIQQEKSKEWGSLKRKCFLIELQKIDGRKDSMINSEPQWIPPSHLFFFTPITVRAVYRKAETAKSKIVLTFPPSRTLQASVQTQSTWVRTAGHWKRSPFFFPFPACTSSPKIKERENKQAAFLSSQSMKITHYTQGSRNHLEFLHLHALSQQFI